MPSLPRIHRESNPDARRADAPDSRRASIPTYALVGLILACLLAIYALTEQSEAQSSALSGAADSLLCLVVPPDACSDPHTWLSLNIRQLAHPVEYWVLGLVVCLATPRILSDLEPPLAKGLSCGLCAAASLCDQLHKIFVPGRHFDAFDLALDALGYLGAALIVGACTALARRTRPLC